jgi:hypothetical protein
VTESRHAPAKEQRPYSNLPNLVEAQTLALAVIDAMIDPFVVLDDRVRLVVASRSFYDTFKVEAETARGQSFYDLCRRRLGRSPPCAICLPTSYRRKHRSTASNWTSVSPTR